VAEVPGPATPPTALTIAGSDSGGGAGAQADLKTFAAHGVHGTSALTAVTAQNTAEVRGVVALDPDFVRLQIETVLDDFDVRSVKTGMLANRAIVEVVADLAAGAPAPGSWSTRCWSPPAGRR
jgi:hydroxymethylpyrimidine kinase/phosphomethylpyrimidine kinase